MLDHEVVHECPELRRVLEIMQRSADQAALLAGAVFDLRRASEDVRNPVDLPALTETVCHDCALGTPPSLETALEPDQCTIYEDAGAIRRALGNLIENAKRFAHQKIRVRLHIDVRPQRAVLWVEDDGRGLPTAAAYREA